MTELTENSTNNINPQLKISQLAEVYIREMAKWGYFLSIVGFVMTGIIVLIGLIFMVSMPFSAFNNLPMGRMPGGMGFLFGLMYIVMGALYIFPCLYLFRSSKAFKTALAMQDEHQITKAFENQKSLFKFMGIFTIIILGFYAIMIVFGTLGALFAG